MNTNTVNRSNLGTRVKQVVAGATAMVVAGAASAATTGVDNTEILASVADAQAKGVAIAAAVTIMIFAFAAAKWLRRAK